MIVLAHDSVKNPAISDCRVNSVDKLASVFIGVVVVNVVVDYDVRNVIFLGDQSVQFQTSWHKKRCE